MAKQVPTQVQFRSSVTGQFSRPSAAKASPSTTEREVIKHPERAPTSKPKK